ncbi:GT2 family glycosyltransferase [Spirosoma sp. LMG 31448]|uniref:GT2 family glycosyltransferase n=1 Tax=Spirosoma utsteinense TaxID=2585773 RepID=A0ABR6W0D3_9BACT|nr:GT2 family glycosyltransferase [Spirosoma utsteinense]MBC3790071.1 GT2 family glycosyltransferase [Spirosoma utsteinense]
MPTLTEAASRLAHEVIIVDNYGQDNLADWLKTDYPTIRFMANPTNSGYSGGNNLGLAHATGIWTLLLNPDTELIPDSLERLVETARQYPNAFITPKLLNPDGTINTCGNQMQYTGVTTCRGLNEPASNYTVVEEVPLLSGAALMAPTKALREVGGFEECYFMYFEDTDLSLRARLAGYTLLCEPRAVLIHYYRLGMSPTKFYYLERNRLLTFLRVFSSLTLRRLIPALILTELLMWGFSLRGLAYVRARCKTYRWLWQNRVIIQQQHQHIQQQRRVSDRQLLRNSLIDMPFDQLVGGRLGNSLNALLRPICQWMRPRL